MGAKIAVLAGSIRKGSFNGRLAALGAERLRAHGADVTEIDLRDYDLPIYCQDTEAEAFPAAALALKDVLRAQHGLLVATPEHNGSISSLLKNAIDWASRPTDGETAVALSAYRGKVAAIMSVSIGPFGGLRALIQLRQTLGTVQLLLLPEQVAVPFADRAFDADGRLVEPLPATLLDQMAQRLVRTAEALRG